MTSLIGEVDEAEKEMERGQFGDIDVDEEDEENEVLVAAAALVLMPRRALVF